MKKFLTFLFLALTTNLSFSQEAKNEMDDTREINQTMKLFGKYLKNADENVLSTIISKNAEKYLKEKLRQMQQQLPKGDLAVEKIARSGTNEFIVVSQIKPFGIPLSIVFDEYYLIKSVAISSDETIEFSDEYELDLNTIVLPFHLVDGFILIDGEVNGKKGKLMFDTGTPFGLFLNNHYLELKKTELMASGSSGSGQLLDVYADSIEAIKIGKQVSYGKMHTIPNADFSFIEQGIAPDFLGFIGYEFLKNYEFLIDYDYQTITLYKLDENGNVLKPYSLTNTVVTTLHFTTSDDKQIPVVEMKLDTITLTGRFDTGGQGHLNLNNSTLNYLIKQGILEQGNQGSWYGQESDEDQIYNMNQLNHALTPLIPSKNYSLEESTENSIDFGYQFLKNYITIWNFQKGTITLLEK